MLSNCFGGYRHNVISFLVLQFYLLDVDVFVFHNSDCMLMDYDMLLGIRSLQLLVGGACIFVGHQADENRLHYFRRPQ
jgi:hypothetical protein